MRLVFSHTKDCHGKWLLCIIPQRQLILLINLYCVKINTGKIPALYVLPDIWLWVWCVLNINKGWFHTVKEHKHSFSHISKVTCEWTTYTFPLWGHVETAPPLGVHVYPSAKEMHTLSLIKDSRSIEIIVDNQFHFSCEKHSCNTETFEVWFCSFWTTVWQ